MMTQKYSRDQRERFAQKLHPHHTALLIIDVQNDFCAREGVMAVDGADLTHVEEMLPRLVNLVDDARKRGVLVVHVRNIYNTPDNAYLSRSFLDVASRRLSGTALNEVPMCVPGKWGAEPVAEINPRPEEPVVHKHRYSGFYQTDLEMILRVHGIQTVVTAGVATNVCVETTARDAFMRDFNVIFPSESTATYYRAAHEATLATIGLHFGEVGTNSDISRGWSDAVDAEIQMGGAGLSVGRAAH